MTVADLIVQLLKSPNLASDIGEEGYLFYDRDGMLLIPPTDFPPPVAWPAALDKMRGRFSV